MTEDTFFSSTPESSQAKKQEGPERRPESLQRRSQEDFTVFLFFFDEARGHLPLLTYPKKLKSDPKEIQTIKIHPVWWLPEEEESPREPVVFEFGGRGYIAKKFHALSKREKYRSGMDSSTPETFVLAIGAPRDFVFLGQELLPLLYSRILSSVGDKLYVLCERELATRKPLKTSGDKLKITDGDQLEENIMRICQDSLPGLSISRLQQRRESQTRLQRRMAQLFLEDIAAAQAPGVRSIALGSKSDQSQARITPKRPENFRMIESERNLEKKAIYLTIMNVAQEEMLEDVQVVISKVRGFFEIETWETSIPIWNSGESIRFEAPLGEEEEPEILIRISDANQSRLMLKKIHFAK
ncbi:MAG: hypothetical protein ACFFB3_14880 [Candidatus Hodarchaeota archaeon]